MWYLDLVIYTAPYIGLLALFCAFLVILISGSLLLKELFTPPSEHYIVSLYWVIIHRPLLEDFLFCRVLWAWVYIVK